MTDHDALEPSSEAMSIARMVHSLTASEGLVYAGKAIDEYLDAHYRHAVDGRPTLPASDAVMAAMRKDVEPWSEREKQVILYLCSAQELSETALLRQALRLYELHYERVKAGERVFWSGDAQRQKDFAALSHPPVDDREEGDKDRENLVARPSDEVREEGEASPRALAILKQIDDAYSYHMGDPDGEDYDAAKNAAALVIDAALSATCGDKDRENLVARPSDEQLDDPTGGERDLGAALLKCRDQFEFYATEHRFKADKAKQEWDDACYWGNVTEQDTKKSEYQKRKKQAETNEQFVALCSAALSAIPAIDGGRFDDWTDAMFISECRAQAFAHLDPDFSRFMSALANRIAAYRAAR